MSCFNCEVSPISGGREHWYGEVIQKAFDWSGQQSCHEHEYEYEYEYEYEHRHRHRHGYGYGIEF
jgi:hypothetical protein